MKTTAKSLQFGFRAAVGASVLAIMASGTLHATPWADPTPAPTPKIKDTRNERLTKASQRAFDARSLNSFTNRIQNQVIDRTLVRLREGDLGAEAGAPVARDYKDAKKTVVPVECVWFCKPTVFSEYRFINSDDMRDIDLDSYTHSPSGGFDFMTVGDVLVGMVYSYSRVKGESDELNAGSRTDANFISLYMAKTFAQFVTLGVTGGYGHTEVETRVDKPFRESQTNEDTWSVSPFLTLSYVHDNLFAALTTSGLFSHTGGDDTTKLNIQMNLGYNVTDWMTTEVYGKASQVFGAPDVDPTEDDNWYGAGTKLTFYLSSHLSAYLGYEFNWNQDFRENSGFTGLSYSF